MVPLLRSGKVARGVRARLAAATAAWVGLVRPVRFRHATTHGKLKGRVIIVGAECCHDGRSRSHSRGGFCKFLRCTAGPQELEEFESRTCAWLGVCEEQDRRLYIKPIRVQRVASLRSLVFLGYQGSVHLTVASFLFLRTHFWLHFQDLLHRYWDNLEACFKACGHFGVCGAQHWCSIRGAVFSTSASFFQKQVSAMKRLDQLAEAEVADAAFE